MEECEICGSKAKDIYIVNVEEVELRVCTKCAKGKKIVSKVTGTSTLRQIPREKQEEVQPLVENYGTVIHNARESMKLPLKVLAEMLNEKETLLLRIEQQRTLPSTELTRKLEKALGVMISESTDMQAEVHVSKGRGDKATLGEFVNSR